MCCRAALGDCLSWFRWAGKRILYNPPNLVRTTQSGEVPWQVGVPFVGRHAIGIGEEGGFQVCSVLGAVKEWGVKFASCCSVAACALCVWRYMQCEGLRTAHAG